MVIADISEAFQDKIKQLWSEKYLVGSEEYGVDFSTRIQEDDLDSLRNYLMNILPKDW